MAELEKKLEKERKKAELAAAQAAKEEQKKISPLEMFKIETDKYSKFDEMVSNGRKCCQNYFIQGLVYSMWEPNG